MHTHFALFKSGLPHVAPPQAGEVWTRYALIRTAGGEAAFSGEMGQSPLGSNAEWENWRWYAEIRTTLSYPEEAYQADGCPATPLAVNSNLGEAKFASVKNWTWYTPIRTALERPFNFRIYLSKTHEYQRISAKARQLRAKGLSWPEIGRKLKVTGKTAKKAVDRRKM